MRIIFITTIYRDEEKAHVERLKKEVVALGFQDFEFYCADNTADNIGYAGGINKGITYGLSKNFDIFVIMNPDISIANIAKEAIVDGLQKFDILGFAMNQDMKTYYGGEIDQWRLSGGLSNSKPSQKYTEVDFVSGALMFIKKNVISRIGMFDQSYFIYYEEVDYCFRAKKSGFNIGIDSKTDYEHLEISKKNNPRKDYFLVKNRIKFFLRYSNFKQKIRELLRIPKTLVESLPLIIKLFLNSRFLINFFSFNLASFANKLFHFILFIFLVRYFAPEKYAVYTLVWAFIGFFSPVLDFGTTSYGLLYSANNKDKSLSALLTLRLMLSAVVFLIAVVIGYLSFKGQLPFFIFLTATVFLANAWSGSYLIINSINNKVFRSSLASLVFNFLLSSVLILSTVLFKSIPGIFQATFFLYLLYAILNIFLLEKALGKIRLNFRIDSWLRILKKSYIFVLIGFFAGIYFKQDIFLLKFLKSDKEVGIYSAGYKFFEALLFIPGSYNIVSMPNLVKLGKNINLLKIKVKKDLLFLFVFGMVIAILFYLLSPYVLTFFLKNNYQLSIKVAQIVMFALPFMLISSIFMNLLYVFEKQWLVVLILAIQIIISFILNLVFIPRFSYLASAYITVLSEVINFCLAFMLVRRYLINET